MPQKGYKITEAERQSLNVTEKQFQNIIDYGARTILEKAFCSFMIDCMGRRQVAENTSFGDIDWENNKFIKYEKYNAGIKRHKEESDIEYNKRKEVKIKEDLRKGKIKEIEFRGNKSYKRIRNGYFSTKTKNLLLELQIEYKTGKIFRRTKASKKAMTPKAYCDMWDRCVARANKRIDELKISPSNKILHPDKNKKITLHDIRRARPRNFDPQSKKELQAIQDLLGHENFQTTFNIYDRISGKETQNFVREKIFKEQLE